MNFLTSERFRLPQAKGKRAPAFSLLFAAFFCCLLQAGCGSSGNGAPPAFDDTHSEGGLIKSQLVMTYATATSGSQTGLDGFYSNLICPSGLSPNDCATNKANLNTAQFGNFDVAADPIANNPAGVQQIDAVKMNYTALNVGDAPVTVSGGLLVPKISPSAIKGIVLYFHGTTVERNNVPSSFTATTNVSGYKDGILWAALWASQGYIVVMPDYIGLGDDANEPHPYVEFPAQNAQSGLSAMLAARTILAKSYQITGTLPLFITGYSEGGGYSLEATQLMQGNPQYAKRLNVQLKKTVPLSGFFDLSQTGVNYLFDNMSETDTNNPWFSPSPLTSIASKPYLSAYLGLSFAYYSKIAATDILAPNFYNDSCSGNSPCGNLFDDYFTVQQYSGYDQVALAEAGDHAINVGYASQSTNYSNSITPLLTSDYAAALQQKQATNPLYAQLIRADTYRFIPAMPVTLVSLEQDSVVTRVNTDVAFQYFEQQNSKGPYQEDLIPNGNFFITGVFSDGNIDHLSELPFMGVLILNEFNTAK